MKKGLYICVVAVLSLMVSSCAKDYLDQQPSGDVITEEQYRQLDNVIEGSVKGIYSVMYAYGGEHDVFGKRAIDMYGDLLCGDMALKTQNYGWFASDELMQSSSNRRSYIWSFYYNIIRLCNKSINALDEQGLPEVDGVDVYSLSEEEQLNGLYYAEVLAIRGWAYAELLRFFTFPPYSDNYTDDWGVPIYTEMDTKADTTLGAPRSSIPDVYSRLEDDLLLAIDYFDLYGTVAERTIKIEINGDVARTILAYSFLNKGDYSNALKYAKEVVGAANANILPQEQVLTTGFNNIANTNWMWGKDVTVDNTTSLASFFGQCDIFSYSYASAGDVKGIDANLYKEITSLGWDIREFWFSNYYRDKKSNYSHYQYAPDGKFYSATSKKLQDDKDWLSDDVFMRMELPYLIAAEAACRLGNISEAQDFLFAITDERVKIDEDGSTAFADAYNTWKSSVTTADALLSAIRYNWRVELWGEGYGLQTFRRYGLSVSLGENHLRTTKNISPTMPSERTFTFEIPTAEYYYNPAIRDLNTLTKKQ